MVLAHDVAGGGPTVVLLHAGAGDRRLWDPQWPTLGKSFRTLRCDLRGFGDSPASSGPFSNGGDVLELLDHHGVERAVIVGGSLGGRVAMEVAVEQPTRVAGLVLVSPALPGHDWSDQVRTFGDDEDDALGRGDVDAAVELNLRMWFDGPGRAPAPARAVRRAAVGEMQRRAFEVQLAAEGGADEDPLVEDLRERVREISAPTVVVVGEHDVSDFHAIGAHLVDTLPAARLVVASDTAHLPNYERPEAFDPALVDALQRAWW